MLLLLTYSPILFTFLFFVFSCFKIGFFLSFIILDYLIIFLAVLGLFYTYFRIIYIMKNLERGQNCE